MPIYVDFLAKESSGLKVEGSTETVPIQSNLSHSMQFAAGSGLFSMSLSEARETS